MSQITSSSIKQRYKNQHTTGKYTMNQTHRSIYNEQTQTYVAVSETVKSKGKASKNTVLAAVIFGALISTTAQAAPEGGQVTAGAATINAAGNTTTINQSSQNAAIDWHKFNVCKTCFFHIRNQLIS